MSTEPKPPGTALAEITPQVDVSSMLALASIIGGSSTPFFTSIDARTPEGKILLFKVSEETDHKIDEVLDTVIDLRDVYVSQATKNDGRTGEVMSLTRCVLIDKGGVSYSTFSDGIAESVKKLIGIYGMPPWIMPLSVRLAKRKTGSGFTMFYLAPVLKATVKEPRK